MAEPKDIIAPNSLEPSAAEELGKIREEGVPAHKHTGTDSPLIKTAVTVQAEGTDVGARSKVNFKEGSNIEITVTDQPGSDAVDVLISAVVPGARLIHTFPNNYLGTSGNALTYTAGITEGPMGLEAAWAAGATRKVAPIYATANYTRKIENVWDNDPAIEFLAETMQVASSGGGMNYQALLVLGGDYDVPTTPTSPAAGVFVKKHMGFYYNFNSSRFLATSGDGAAQTTTDISAFWGDTTGSPTVFTNSHRLRAVMTSGSKIEFYVDDTLVATHTTNLPSGAFASQAIWTWALTPGSTAGAGQNGVARLGPVSCFLG